MLALQQQQQQQQQQQEEGGKGYDSVDGFAKIDYAREARTGLPEVRLGMEGRVEGGREEGKRGWKSAAGRVPIILPFALVFHTYNKCIHLAV